MRCCLPEASFGWHAPDAQSGRSQEDRAGPAPVRSADDASSGQGARPAWTDNMLSDAGARRVMPTEKSCFLPVLTQSAAAQGQTRRGARSPRLRSSRPPRVSWSWSLQSRPPASLNLCPRCVVSLLLAARMLLSQSTIFLISNDNFGEPPRQCKEGLFCNSLQRS